MGAFPNLSRNVPFCPRLSSFVLITCAKLWAFFSQKFLLKRILGPELGASSKNNLTLNYANITLNHAHLTLNYTNLALSHAKIAPHLVAHNLFRSEKETFVRKRLGAKARQPPSNKTPKSRGNKRAVL